MSGLSALLANRGVALAQDGRIVRSIAYFQAARLFDRAGVSGPNVAALSGLLHQRCQQALAANDHPCFVDLAEEQEKIAARCYGGAHIKAQTKERDRS
jgi:hypothetical protein